MDGTKESLLPTKTSLSPTDKIRIVNNDATPVTETVLVSTLEARFIALSIALSQL